MIRGSKVLGGSMQYAGLNVLLPEDNEVIEISRKKRQKEPFPGFTVFGNGKETRNGGKSMDILAICMELNTAEIKLLQFFRDVIEQQKMVGEDNPNKVTPNRHEEFGAYLKIALKKNFAHMKELEILKRMKRGTYMINPSLLIPIKDVVKIKAEWELV